MNIFFGKNYFIYGTSSWCNGYVAGLPCSRLQFESWTRWLKLTLGACACVPKIPSEEWKRGDCAMAIPSGG